MAADNAKIVTHTTITEVPAIGQNCDDVSCASLLVCDPQKMSWNNTLLLDEAQQESGPNIGRIICKVISRTL